MNLSSAPIPPIGPDDHVRDGDGALVVVYADLGCPHCAGAWRQLVAVPGRRIAFRHFPVSSKHPRAPALHMAAEAAGAQGCFFKMVDSLYADRGHVDDPHLWARAERFGLDLRRFEQERRAEAARLRVRRDFESGIRAGVTTTPALYEVSGTVPEEREREF